MFPRNVFGAFAVLVLVTAAVVPVQNLVVWGPDFVLGFYASGEITAEKVSIGAAGLGLGLLYAGYRAERGARDI